MSVLATDVLIKTMIEASFADLRKNSWLLDDVFSGLAQDSLAKTDYGYKEVTMAKQWFLENQIDVYLSHRIDTPRFPSITIVQTSSREMTERASLSDDGLIEDFEPGAVTKRVEKIYEEFTPSAYNDKDGTVTLPSTITTVNVIVGQFLVSKKSGKAYVITAVADDKSFTINSGMKDDFTDAYIVPPTSIWNVHRELSFLDESFAIGLHAQSDLNQAIWLRQLMTYVFLRYKESYLEKRGFELSTFSVGSIDENPHFQAEKIYSCPLTVSGQVEVQWIKFVAPKLQAAYGQIRIADGPATPVQYGDEIDKASWKMEND